MKAKKLLTREEIICAELGEGRARLCRVMLQLREARPLDPGDMNFLANAFEAILGGIAPKKALGISGKQAQGRAKRSAAEEDKIELAPVLEIMRLRKREGLTVESAVDQVAMRFDIPRTTLERYYKRHRKVAAFFISLAASRKVRRQESI